MVSTALEYAFMLGIYVFFAGFIGGMAIFLIYFFAPNFKYKNELGLFIALVLVFGMYVNETDKVEQSSDTLDEQSRQYELEIEELELQVAALDEAIRYVEGCYELSMSSLWEPDDLYDEIANMTKQEIVNFYDNVIYSDAMYYYHSYR